MRKEEGRRTKEEGRRKKEEGRREKGERRREKGEGRREKEKGRREKGEGERKKGGGRRKKVAGSGGRGGAALGSVGPKPHRTKGGVPSAPATNQKKTQPFPRDQVKSGLSEALLQSLR